MQLQSRMILLEPADRPDLPIFFSVQNGIKMSPVEAQRIISEAKKLNVSFIIFDSLRCLHSAKENDSGEMQEVMEQFKKITRAGFTILICHHNRKKIFGATADPSEDSRGSNAINAAIHGHLTCEPKKDGTNEYLVINQAKLKGAAKLQPFKVRVCLGEEAPFVYDGNYDKKSSDEMRESVAEKIIGHLRFHEGKGLTVKEFKTIQKIGGEKILRETLNTLCEDGILLLKDGQEVSQEGLSTLTSPQSHNTNYYFLNEPEESPAESP